MGLTKKRELGQPNYKFDVESTHSAILFAFIITWTPYNGQSNSLSSPSLANSLPISVIVCLEVCKQASGHL
jgi:hypothetical protein